VKAKVVVASGIFNILHRGHLEYLRMAKALGDILIVLVDSDRKTIENKGYLALDEEARVDIISELKCVDIAKIIDISVAEALELIKPDIFCKGGDRTLETLPQEEINACQKNGIEIVTGLGDKINSSSELYKKVELWKKHQK